MAHGLPSCTAHLFAPPASLLELLDLVCCLVLFAKNMLPLLPTSPFPLASCFFILWNQLRCCLLQEAFLHPGLVHVCPVLPWVSSPLPPSSMPTLGLASSIEWKPCEGSHCLLSVPVPDPALGRWYRLSDYLSNECLSPQTCPEAGVGRLSECPTVCYMRPCHASERGQPCWPQPGWGRQHARQPAASGGGAGRQ